MTSSADECMRITISMQRNGTNPVITQISTEGLMTTKTDLLELGMEVTSLSYNGESAYLARGNLTRKQKNGGKYPFLVKQSVLVPGAGVIAVAVKKASENNTGPFLIRGVTVGSQSSWRGSQLMEVLVYSVAGMKDDSCGTDDSEREDDSANEGSTSEHRDEDSVCSSEAPEESPCCIRQNVLWPGPHKFSWGPPPLGIPCGGYWSTQKYIGRQTIVTSLVGCFCLGLVGPMVLCCPLDERNVYIVNGRVYSECGKCVALEG